MSKKYDRNISERHIYHHIDVKGLDTVLFGIIIGYIIVRLLGVIL